jgi:hypothetical protein
MSSFAKTLAEVVLDGARADEQLGANLRVRLTLAGEAPGAARVVAKRSSSSRSALPGLPRNSSESRGRLTYSRAC